MIVVFPQFLVAQHRVEGELLAVADVEALLDHAVREFQRVDAMHHLAVLRTRQVIRAWLEGHQSLAQMVDERVGQVVGLAVFRILSQFVKFEFDKD